MGSLTGASGGETLEAPGELGKSTKRAAGSAPLEARALALGERYEIGRTFAEAKMRPPV
jgi:hypothetical protein